MRFPARNRYCLMLAVVFLYALVLRFFYFPNDIYFGFDQARDAFAAKKILEGDLRVIGPPTSFEGLFHGPLYYYLYAPVYYFGGGDPSLVSAFIRVYNALGIVLIFKIASLLFNPIVGLFAAILFALSFEQAQFSLYMNHPSFAVLSVMAMYWGLALLTFSKNRIGLPISLFGLGLSVQFEMILSYLIVPYILTAMLFFRNWPIVKLRFVLTSLIFLLIPLSSYALSALIMGRGIFGTFGSLLLEGGQKDWIAIISTYLYQTTQMVKFNISGDTGLEKVATAGIFLIFAYCLTKGDKLRSKLKFLGIWFFSVFAIYWVSGGEKDLAHSVPLYYPNVGVSASLVIFTAFLVFKLWEFNRMLGAIVLSSVILANLFLSLETNLQGSIPSINTQSGMLLIDEIRVLDYLYQDAKGEQFAVKGITMPYIINTTWSYLFEWYGNSRYGYVPVWGGKNAYGYPGNLPQQDAQSDLPPLSYLIIEPSRGIPQHLINAYLQEESYFTRITDEKKIGLFTVQRRIRI